MKKQIGYLLLALCILSVNKVFADPLGTVLPAQVQAEMGGYNPGAFNTTEMQNINRFQIDKSYIQSFDEVTKDEQIYDASIEENQAREGVLYNPHFLLQKINFEGNTEIPTEELEKLGLEILGEDIFFDHEMTDLDLAVSSFGQGFAVTPMQMITAISAIANGGYLMQPYIVKEIVDSDGNIVETTTPTVKRQVISKEVSERLNEILYGNVNEGGATNGYVAGYEVAGKTGTSEKLNDNKDHIASFCGYAPYDDPQIVMLLYFDSPRGVLYHGSTVAAPVFASIMEEVLPYLEVERHYTEEELENIDTTANTYIGLSIDEATSNVEEDGFEAVVKGSGSTVIAQVPESGTKIPNSGKVVLYTDDASKEETVTVPDFSGLTVTEASQKAAEYNLNISITGATNVYNSVVQTQSIDSGKEVSPGTVVTLTFVGAGIGD